MECYYLEAHDFYSMLGEFVDKFTKLNEFRIIRSSKVMASLSDHKLRELMPKLTMHRMFSGQRVVCGHQEVYMVIDGEYQANNTGEKFSSENINIGECVGMMWYMGCHGIAPLFITLLIRFPGGNSGPVCGRADPHFGRRHTGQHIAGAGRDRHGRGRLGEEQAQQRGG